MPLKWERGKNLYADTYYARLKLGPNVTPNLIVSQAANLKQKLSAGSRLEAAGRALDEHAISEAQKELLDAEARAEELLLVHPEPAKESKRGPTAADGLLVAAAPSHERPPLPLWNAAALFWFTRPPGVEAAPLPPWDAFEFVGPGAPADVDADIVFDR
jgi:hypothetical protein